MSDYIQIPWQNALYAQEAMKTAHTFFLCLFAWMIWTRQSILLVDPTSEMSFWVSIQRGRHRRKEGRDAYLWCYGPCGCTGMINCLGEGGLYRQSCLFCGGSCDSLVLQALREKRRRREKGGKRIVEAEGGWFKVID